MATLVPTTRIVETSHPEGHPRRWWVLAALCLSLLVVGLDGTVLNVALDRVAGALHASTTDLQWVVNGYLLTFAVLLIPMGVLGDRLGRSRVLAGGLAVFLVASTAGAWATSPEALVLARVAMGLGAAAVFPISLSVIPTVFAAGERTKAVAVVTAAMGLGMPLGPLVGGWLLDHFWWGSTLLFNVPIVAVALVAGLLLVPNTREARPTSLDLPGLLLSGAGLAAVVFGLVSAPVDGWASPKVLAVLGAGLVLLAGLAFAERRARTPLVGRDLAANRLFTGPTLAMAVTSFVMLGLLFVVPVYLQAVRGDSALLTGVELMPIMLALVVGAGAGSRAVRLLGLRGTVALGLLLSGAGFLLMLRVTVDSGYAPLAVGFALVGFGFGVSMPPATDAFLSALPVGRESTGTGVNQAVKQLGGALGVALLGSLVNAAYRSGVEHAANALPAAAGDMVRESAVGGNAVAGTLGGHAGRLLHDAVGAAYVSGMHTTSVACACFAVLAAVLMLALLPAGAPIADAGAA